MCGVFDPEDSDHLQSFSLILKSLQVMREGQQVYIWREPHCRMAPVTVHENTKLAAAGDGVHAVLRSLELIASGAERPFDQ